MFNFCCNLIWSRKCRWKLKSYDVPMQTQSPIIKKHSHARVPLWTFFPSCGDLGWKNSTCSRGWHFCKQNDWRRFLPISSFQIQALSLLRQLYFGSLLYYTHFCGVLNKTFERFIRSHCLQNRNKFSASFNACSAWHYKSPYGPSCSPTQPYVVKKSSIIAQNALFWTTSQFFLRKSV